MARYKKRPIDVVAYQFGDEAIPAWLFDAIASREVTLHCVLKSSEGKMRVDIGDYIIQGVEGEVYACSMDVFEKTYDEVSA